MAIERAKWMNISESICGPQYRRTALERRFKFISRPAAALMETTDSEKKGSNSRGRKRARDKTITIDVFAIKVFAFNSFYGGHNTITCVVFRTRSTAIKERQRSNRGPILRLKLMCPSGGRPHLPGLGDDLLHTRSDVRRQPILNPLADLSNSM